MPRSTHLTLSAALTVPALSPYEYVAILGVRILTTDSHLPSQCLGSGVQDQTTLTTSSLATEAITDTLPGLGSYPLVTSIFFHLLGTADPTD
jgi:hypothetical protein